MEGHARGREQAQEHGVNSSAGTPTGTAETRVAGPAVAPIRTPAPRTWHGLRPDLLAILAVAEFMLTLDVSIVNVALPAISRDLGFGQSSLQWVVNAYALAFGGCLLLGGRAADLFGGRRVFLAAMAVFSAASLACGLAPTPAALIIARGVQGASAGVLAPATLSILTSTYRDRDVRNRALAIWTAVAIGGGAVGGLLGGVITTMLSWPWIFLVNVPVGAALVVLAGSRIAGRDRTFHRADLDIPGAVTITGSITALTWALIRSAEVGWGETDVVGGIAAAVALFVAFAYIETRAAHAPLVPLALFRIRPLTAGNALSFLSFLPVVSIWYFLTLYMQDVRGYTPMQAGLLFLPVALCIVAGSQLSFRMLSVVDGRWLLLAGGLIAAAGLAWLSRLSGTTEDLNVVVSASVTMIGSGLVFGPITIAATASVPPEQSGLASGLLNSTRQIGGAVGLAVLGAVAAAVAARAGGGQDLVSGGYGTALMIAAAIFAVTGVLGALILPARLGGADGTRLDAQDAPGVGSVEGR